MEQKNNVLNIPLAIVFAGILIAGAVIYTGGEGRGNANVNAERQNQQEQERSLSAMRPVGDRDYIRGNRNAEVMVVEYSDTGCPLCKQFHFTMKRIMEEYGASGRVAWVYRHFPLDRFPNSRIEATAFECAGELGGNEKFWQYVDRLYEITPSNGGLAISELPKIAEYVGLDVAGFNECIDSGRHNSKVEEDLQNAIATGGRGTPWSIIVTRDGKKVPISGAYPFEQIKAEIDQLLR